MEEVYFSKNIKHFRKKLKLKQHEIANALEIKEARYVAYELNRCEPPLYLLVRMTKFFGVKMNDLVSLDLSKTNIQLKAL